MPTCAASCNRATSEAGSSSVSEGRRSGTPLGIILFGSGMLLATALCLAGRGIMMTLVQMAGQEQSFSARLLSPRMLLPS